MWHRRRRSEDAGGEVVSEASALLSGTAIDRFRERGIVATTPSWLLVNALAHAQPARLHEWAIGGVAGRPTNLDASLARLSRLILDTACTDDDIRSLQRDVLVPFELSLLGGVGRRLAAADLEPTMAKVIAGLDGGG